MKALVYLGPGKKSWEEKPDPVLEAPSDALVRMVKTTICDTDLHIVHGRVPSVMPGTIIGHEGVGIVYQTGSDVTRFKKGDQVLISCITACGSCVFCKKSMFSHCEAGGWILGNTIDGTQAEYVRIPHADNSLHLLPEGTDIEAFVMLSDVLPTGFECGVLNGKVIPGKTVAIVGAGPVGMAVLLTAQMHAQTEIIMIDADDDRLGVAKTFGVNHVINLTSENAVEKIMQLTHDKGVDVAIEAMGMPSSFELCEAIVGNNGHIANIGSHGTPMILNLETLWSRNISITSRLADTKSTPSLLKLVQSGALNANQLITHHFQLDQVLEAYDALEQQSPPKALKIILTQ